MSTGLDLSDRVYHYDTNPAIRAELTRCPSSRNEFGTPLDNKPITIQLNDGSTVKFRRYEDFTVTEFRNLTFVLDRNDFEDINLETLPDIDPLKLLLELSRLHYKEA